MPDFDLGTARGHIVIDSSGVETGIGKAKAATSSFESDLKSHSATLTKTGIAMTAVGAAAVAGFGLAIGAAANFEERISAIKAVSGGTQQQMDAVRKTALRLGADTKFSAGEAATAMEELAKAGLSLPDILNGAADATTNLAAAGGIALPEAATIAANAMNQFNLKAADMPHVADLIAGAANASAIDVSEFGTSMAQAGAVAHLAGLSFGDTAVAIAEMGNAGIKGSDAGTSLKTFLQNLIPQTEQQIELMQRLGIIQTNNGVTAKEYAAAVKVQTKASSDLTKAQQTLTDIQAKYAVAGAPKSELERVNRSIALRNATDEVAGAQKRLASVNDQVKKGIGETSNAFFDANGNVKSLADISQVLQDSLRGQTKEQQLSTLQTLFGSDAIRAAAVLADQGAAGFNKMSDSMGKVKAADVAAERMNNLKGSLEQMKGSFETAMISIGELGQGPGKAVIDWVTKLLNSFTEMSPKTQEIIIAVIGLVAGITGLLGAFVLIVGAAGKLVTAFIEFKKAMAFIKELQLASRAMAALNASFLANPVFLIIAALVALGIGLYELYKHSETFRHAVDALWQGIQVAFHAIVGIVSKAVDFIKDHWMDLALILAGPIGIAIIIWRHFGDDIIGVVKGIFNAVVGWFERMAHDIANWVSTGVRDVIGFFTALPGEMARLGAQVLNAIITEIGKLPAQIGFILGFIIGALIKWHIDMVTKAIEIGTQVLAAIISFFEQLPGRIAGFFADVWNATVQFALDMTNKSIELGTNFLNAIISFFTQLPGRIAGFFAAAFSATVAWVSSMIGKATEIGAGVLNAIVGFFSRLPGEVGRYIADMASKVAEAVTSIGGDAAKIGSNIWHGIIDTITNLPGEVGKIIGRIIDAIKGAIKDAFNAVKDFAGGMWEGFKKGLHISSPSIIERTMYGIVDTVGSSIDQLRGQVRSLQGISSSMVTPTPSAAVAGSVVIPMTRGSNTVIHGDTNTTGGDHIEFHQVETDPDRIINKLAWNKRIRSRVA